MSAEKVNDRFLILKREEDHPPLPDDLEPWAAPRSNELYYGFKVVESETGHRWQPIGEDERRECDAAFLGVAPEEVDLPTSRVSCYQAGPTRCSGNCPRRGTSCVLVYDPVRKVYFCRCL